MSSGVYQLDQGDPLFVVSYARVAATRHEVIRLFRDLFTNVSELVGRSVGADAGFIDNSMGGGERWTPDLLHAIGTCQVFLPLISASLLDSEWCGMEWDAFARRKRIRRADGQPDHATGILPVTWSPTDPADLPAAVRDIQWFSPSRLPDSDLPTLYAENGMYGLLQLGLEKEYRAIVWRLAQRIVAIYRTHWVSPLITTSAKELRNAFREEEVQ